MSVLLFIRKHIIQQEEWYEFYNHKDIHHNEEYSNTLLEGTNNVIKHSSSSTHSQMSMSNAMRILCEQSTQKKAIKRAHHQENLENISTNFESKPIHDRITIFVLSKIWGLFKASKTSSALEVNQIHVKICRRSITYNSTHDRHLSKFKRIRIVKFNNGRLHCSCPLTVVWGIPCVHAICVASAMAPHWDYPSHRDISVLWWKSYLKTAIQTTIVDQDNPNTITRMFRKLQEEEEIVGLNIEES